MKESLQSEKFKARLSHLGSLPIKKGGNVGIFPTGGVFPIPVPFLDCHKMAKKNSGNWPKIPKRGGGGV